MVMTSKDNCKGAYGGFNPADNATAKNGGGRQFDTAPKAPPFGGGSNAIARKAVQTAMAKGTDPR